MRKLLTALLVSAFVTGGVFLLRKKKKKSTDVEYTDDYDGLVLQTDEPKILFGKLNGEEIGMPVKNTEKGTNTIVVGDKSHNHFVSSLLSAECSAIVVGVTEEIEKICSHALEQKGYAVYSFQLQTDFDFSERIASALKKITTDKGVIFLNGAEKEGENYHIHEIFQWLWEHKQNRSNIPVMFWMDMSTLPFTQCWLKEISMERTYHYLAGYHLFTRYAFDATGRIIGEFPKIAADCTVILVGRSMDDYRDFCDEKIEIPEENSTKNLVLAEGFTPIICDGLNMQDYLSGGDV